MRIVHISDLHFGNLNKPLKTNLRNRLSGLKPDVIVCTGDLADDTKEKLLTEAYAYLEELQKACPMDTDRPKVIVIPGNHDYRKNGFLWLDRDRQYLRIFGSEATDYWYKPENVWIFGFDSASQGSAGGSGLATLEELERFHQRCENLEAQDPAFKDAFKIVALHHHPLPVNWDTNWRDRWLTMQNAGAFLSAVLFRRVDLVLHGHEHLQARARLWSTLGENDHETTVVSLGATLRQVEKPNKNWFGVIDINPNGASIDFYSSVGVAFHDKPEQPSFQIRSRSQSSDLEFERHVRDLGYSYREVSSLTTIGIDGDARRRVELDGLAIKNPSCERKDGYPFDLPLTSGYLDCLHITNASCEPAIPRGSRSPRYSGRILFDPPLGVDEPHSYALGWYAVNAFAMDTQQFDYLHSEQPDRLDNTEYTHITVRDPISELTVVVKFPDGFTPAERPRLRVVTPVGETDSRNWKSEPETINRLNRERALRYYDSLSIAALRVRKPTIGLSYGIEWKLPRPPSPEVTQVVLDTREFRKTWLHGPTDPAQKQQVCKILARITIAARKAFLSDWDGPLEASFLYFDGRGTLKLLAAVEDHRQVAVEKEYSLELRYGDGIAGRAFKANDTRVYAETEDDENLEPDFYTRAANGPIYKCLLAIPVRPPSGATAGATGRVCEPYGVLSLGSIQENCPITLMANSSGPARREELKVFQQAVNLDLYDSFARVFLGRQTP